MDIEIYNITNITYHSIQIFIKEKTNPHSNLFNGYGNITLRPGETIEVECDRVDKGQIEWLESQRHGPFSTGMVLKVLKLLRSELYNESSSSSEVMPLSIPRTLMPSSYTPRYILKKTFISTSSSSSICDWVEVDIYNITNTGRHSIQIYIKEKTNLYSNLFKGYGNVILRPGEVIEVEQDRVNESQIEWLSSPTMRKTGKFVRVIGLKRMVGVKESSE